MEKKDLTTNSNNLTAISNDLIDKGNLETNVAIIKEIDKALTLNMQESSNSIVADFHSCVLKEFLSITKKTKETLPKLRIGVAVSGGADSICLLYSFLYISKLYSFPLFVISVDHKIRSKEESRGDANFVALVVSRARAAGYNVKVTIKEAEDGWKEAEDGRKEVREEEEKEGGEVARVAKMRKGGLEDAARAVRYRYFYQYISENNLDYLVTAHNLNDSVETLFMHLFQGSSIEKLTGISAINGKIVRPLLTFSRVRIEAFLKNIGASYRTDKTNANLSFYRNRIRGVLLPLLDKYFMQNTFNYQEGIKLFTNKTLLLTDYITSEVSKIFPTSRGKGFVTYNREAIKSVHNALLIRVIFRDIAELRQEEREGEREVKRVSYANTLIILKKMKEGLEEKAEYCTKEVSIGFNKTHLYIRLIKKEEKLIEEGEKEVFYNIRVEEGGIYENDYLYIECIGKEGGYKVKFYKKNKEGLQNADTNSSTLSDKRIGFNGMADRKKRHSLFCTLEGLTPPFLVRSVIIGDEVKDSNGNYRSLASLFSARKIKKEKRCLIPVIEDGKIVGKVRAVLFSFYGKEDYKVQ